MKTKECNLLGPATLIVAIGTCMLAFIAFSQYVIEARPNLFISEISLKSTPQKVIYTLYNSGLGSANDIKITFTPKVELLNEKGETVKVTQEEFLAENIDHLYAKQQMINTLGLGLILTNRPMRYKITLTYTITYNGKLFLIVDRPYLESGSIVYNGLTETWLVYPD